MFAAQGETTRQKDMRRSAQPDDNPTRHDKLPQSLRQRAYELASVQTQGLFSDGPTVL
jgi:hypothetical protein